MDITEIYILSWQNNESPNGKATCSSCLIRSSHEYDYTKQILSTVWYPLLLSSHYDVWCGRLNRNTESVLSQLWNGRRFS